MFAIWGGPTWIFFHTFAEKLKDDKYIINKQICFEFIESICANLPCSICSKQAKNYLNNVNINFD